MRHSLSFSREEIVFADQLFATLRRGGDVSRLLTSKPGVSTMAKISGMRLRSDRALKLAPPGLPETPDHVLATVDGLHGILTYTECARVLGIRPGTLHWRLLRWRHRRRMRHLEAA